MRFDFMTWEATYEPHEMFKVNVCGILSAMASISTGMKTEIEWFPGWYRISSDPFNPLSYAERGLFSIDKGSRVASQLINEVLQPKLLPYGLI